MKKTDNVREEIRSLNLDDLDVEKLENRLEMAAALPSWCCSQCDSQCNAKAKV